MTWRIEASGGTGSANLVVIQSVTDDDPYDPVRHVLIRISPKAGRELPSMPLFPVGSIYRDRDGMAYRIREATVIETGSPDGEHSMWSYEYLAAYSAMLPAEVAS